MDCYVKIQSLLQIEKRKWVIMVGLVALTHLFCQSLMLPYGNALLSLLPNENSKNLVIASSSHEDSSVKALIDDNSHIAGVLNVENDQSLLARRVKSAEMYNVRVNGEDDKDFVEKEEKEKMNSGLDGNVMDDDVDFLEDDTLDDVDVDLEEGFTVDNSTHLGKASTGVVLESKTSAIQEKNVTDATLVVSSDKPLLIDSVVGKKTESEASISDGSGMHISLSKSNDVSTLPYNGSSVPNKSAKKKMRCDMPPKTVTPINEMERLLVRHRARSRAMRPRWSSERDQEILAAKMRIESAPFLKNDRELHAPLFRNISMFKRLELAHYIAEFDLLDMIIAHMVSIHDLFFWLNW